MRICIRSILCCVIVLLGPAAHSAIPSTLHYQASLTNTDGSPVEGNKVITFSIYAVEFDGAQLWTDTQLVSVEQGLFSVELGGLANPFPMNLFSTPLFIGIEVDGDGEMLPRGRLTSAAFAFEADNALSLQGLGPAAYDQSVHVSDTANPHAVTAVQVGAASATDVASLQSQLDAALVSIAALQADLASANATIVTLQNDLAAETTARIDADNAEAAARQSDINVLTTTVSALETNTVLALDGMLTLDQTDPTLPAALFSGVNVQVVNGTGTTEGDPDGLGNVIIGYNVESTSSPFLCSKGQYDNQIDCEAGDGVWAQSHKSGSHNLIVGERHNYSRFGGIVAGSNNTITGDWSSVSGGFKGIARGNHAVVGGGLNNTASGAFSKVGGGGDNWAFGSQASISGGGDNFASGFNASICGGRGGIASGDYAAVSAGRNNSVTGNYAGISGGARNVADGSYSSISGGGDYGTPANGHRAEGSYSSICGGRANRAYGDWSVVVGGNTNTAGNTALGAGDADNRHSVVVGGQFNETHGQYSVVSGGQSRIATGIHDWRAGTLVETN